MPHRPHPQSSAASGRADHPSARYAAAQSAAGTFSDGIPASPPAEVLDAMSAAGDAYDRLKYSGRRLHFETDPVTGKLSVQVLDPEGNVVATVPPSKVLHLAAGGSLD